MAGGDARRQNLPKTKRPTLDDLTGQELHADIHCKVMVTQLMGLRMCGACQWVLRAESHSHVEIARTNAIARSQAVTVQLALRPRTVPHSIVPIMLRRPATTHRRTRAARVIWRSRGGTLGAAGAFGGFAGRFAMRGAAPISGWGT